jgi:hypothetical protein
MKTYSRQAPDDRARFLAALSAGTPSIGFGPQCLVLGSLPSVAVRALCEAIEVYSDGAMGPVQFREQIARCAKRNGATTPAIHVRLCDAIANVPREHDATIAALILAAVAS